MVLVQDGVKDNYFSLANEKTLPDLNVEKYLDRLLEKQLGIVKKELSNGTFLELHNYHNSSHNKVTISKKTIESGMYKSVNERTYYNVRNGYLNKILNEKIYKTLDGINIEIRGDEYSELAVGSYVYHEETPFQNKQIELDETTTLVIKDGKIFRIILSKTKLSKRLEMSLIILGVVLFFVGWYFSGKVVLIGQYRYFIDQVIWSVALLLVLTFIWRKITFSVKKKLINSKGKGRDRQNHISY